MDSKGGYALLSTRAPVRPHPTQEPQNSVQICEILVQWRHETPSVGLMSLLLDSPSIRDGQSTSITPREHPRDKVGGPAFTPWARSLFPQVTL